MKHYVFTARKLARAAGLRPPAAPSADAAGLAFAPTGHPAKPDPTAVHIVWLDLRRSGDVVTGHIRPAQPAAAVEPTGAWPGPALHVPGSGPGAGAGTPYFGIWSLN
jgi:hypothetical protein